MAARMIACMIARMAVRMIACMPRGSHWSCVEETSKRLVAETRLPVRMKPDQPARCDHECRRNGTTNLFMAFAPLEGLRHVKVTDRRTNIDCAHFLRNLSDIHVRHAEKIIPVQDNLSAHAALSQALKPQEARRLVERFECTTCPRMAVQSGRL